MISLVDALGFRALRNLEQPLDPFHVLVGPNASGKTTFLDVIAFLSRVVSDGLEAAVRERTSNPVDLVFGRAGKGFQLAIELKIPDDLRAKLAISEHDTIRYEVAIAVEPELSFEAEKVVLLTRDVPVHRQIEMFPEEPRPRSSLLTPETRGVRATINKVHGGNDNFYSETHSEPGKGWTVAYKLGVYKSALGNLPEDESKFPVSTWLKKTLSDGVQQLVLNSLAIRRASPPGQPRGFRPDGSNLPWVVADLEERASRGDSRLADWIAHVRTALPDLVGIRTVERPDDRHRYLMFRYESGVEVPSWMASDGTLRLLALTLPAYLPEFRGIYLIEEPENGIHPRAVETVFDSLSSVYDAQILVASHSPVMLSLARPKNVLCFAKTVDGAVAVVRGSEHPALREWRGETDLGTLFAAGVLS